MPRRVKNDLGLKDSFSTVKSDLPRKGLSRPRNHFLGLKSLFSPLKSHFLGLSMIIRAIQSPFFRPKKPLFSKYPNLEKFLNSKLQTYHEYLHKNQDTSALSFNNAEYLLHEPRPRDLANGNSGGGAFRVPRRPPCWPGSDGIPELYHREFDTYEADPAMPIGGREPHLAGESSKWPCTIPTATTFIYIITRISRAGTLPLEAERDAGKFLYKVIKPYNGIARLPHGAGDRQDKGLLGWFARREQAVRHHARPRRLPRRTGERE